MCFCSFCRFLTAKANFLHSWTLFPIMFNMLMSTKHFLKVFCGFLFIFFVNSALAASDSEILKLVPNDDELADWIRDGETALATDEESLSGLINGAAPFYIEHGAAEIIFQDYIKGDVWLTLEIYRMKTEEQAKRLYAEINVENPETLKATGTEGRLVSGLIGVYLLESWQKTFFIRLTITDKSQQSKETILNFAKTVSKKIKKENTEPCQDQTGYSLGGSQSGFGFSGVLSGECDPPTK